VNEWNIAHAGKARICPNNDGCGIDDESCGSDIAMEPASDGHLYWWIAINGDAILGIGCADIHTQFEVQHFLALQEATRNLAHTGNLAWFHTNKFRLEQCIRDHWFYQIFAAFKCPAEASCQHVQRFGQTNMANATIGDFGRKCRCAQSRPNLALKWAAPPGRIHNP
jgi:hypothetical protein